MSLIAIARPNRGVLPVELFPLFPLSGGQSFPRRTDGKRCPSISCWWHHAIRRFDVGNDRDVFVGNGYYDTVRQGRFVPT